jgi:hypothetical protein
MPARVETSPFAFREEWTLTGKIWQEVADALLLWWFGAQKATPQIKTRKPARAR